MAAIILYIVVHVIVNFYVQLRGWGSKYFVGPNILCQVYDGYMCGCVYELPLKNLTVLAC